MNLCQKATTLAQAVIRDEITLLPKDDLDTLKKAAGCDNLPPDLLAHLTLRNRARKIGIFAENCMSVVEPLFAPFKAVAC